MCNTELGGIPPPWLLKNWFDFAPRKGSSGLMMEVSAVGLLKEIRRVSDPDKAQIIWDGIKVGLGGRKSTFDDHKEDVAKTFSCRPYALKSRSQPCLVYQDI